MRLAAHECIDISFLHLSTYSMIKDSETDLWGNRMCWYLLIGLLNSPLFGLYCVLFGVE